MSKPIDLTVPMAIDVDGAPNSYGPDNAAALDFELNAHAGARRAGKIVGYLTGSDGRAPIVQGPADPCPGFYISTTSYADKNNPRATDPRRYVNAAEINYTLLARAARAGGVQLGDFCVVHSLRTGFTVYAIVGDSGNSAGAEGSLALLQRLGYAVKSGKAGGEDDRKIVVRYFPGSNPERRFFFTQAELETAARALGLDTDFSAYHRGDPGRLVLTAIATTATGLVENVVGHILPFVPLAQKPAPYPGHLIRLDSRDHDSVKRVQRRLRELGYKEPDKRGRPIPLLDDGDFGDHTKDAVELFQIRHTDLDNNPLEVDGEVGSQTWGALFGRETVPVAPAAPSTGILGKVLELASAEIGVLEVPPGSNRGKRVQEFQSAAGVSPGDPWCAAFVCFIFGAASRALGIANPVSAKKCVSGSVLDLWNRARTNGVPVVTAEEALDDPGRIKPGMVFIISTGGGCGHTGLVSGISGIRLETIEGNTNGGGSREGIGVFRRSGRTVPSINRGFIDFGAAV